MFSQLGVGLICLSILSCIATPAPVASGITTNDLETRQTAAMYMNVNLQTNTGASIHRASGVLYGVPNTQGQIPSTFYTAIRTRNSDSRIANLTIFDLPHIGFNYLSAGGAQFTGATGWIFGGYTGRFQNVLSNYKTARSFNAQFILKMSDLWGADGTQGSSAIYPFDNGSWTEYDRFLTQFVADLKANGMTSNIKLLIWNEPDLTLFWTKGLAVYLDTWSHTVQFLRANLAGVPIAGPSMANMPNASNTWWTSWLARIKADGTAPNVYTWHLEGSITDVNNDLQTTQPAMVNLLNLYGLAIGEFIIDEYATAAEQNPSGAGWWISRLERYNMSGLRGNWASGAALQDFLASLLAKSGSTYSANGEFQVYKYYATSMKGNRVATTGSTDRKMDSYATVDSSARIVRILVGGRVVTGTYQLQINSLSSLGLPTAGTLTVRTRQFSYSGSGTTVGAPTDLGTVAHAYTGNLVSFPIFQTTTTTTWAFEFSY